MLPAITSGLREAMVIGLPARAYVGCPCGIGLSSGRPMASCIASSNANVL